MTSVDVAGLADFGVHETRTARMHLDRSLARQPAEKVQGVNGHVAQEAAGHLDVLDRRRLEVAGNDLYDFHLANVAAADTLVDRLELGQEAPGKVDEHRHVGAARLLRQRPRLGQIEGDGLLAVDGLPRADRPTQQVDVGVGR